MQQQTEKEKSETKNDCWPEGRPPKFLRPYLLLLLLRHKSHGYELFERLQNMGFAYTTQDAGYIYRKLRAMESDGLIVSQWNTQGIGPAKRIYNITPKGFIMLGEWAKSLEQLKNNLEKFLNSYRELKSKS